MAKNPRVRSTVLQPFFYDGQDRKPGEEVWLYPEHVLVMETMGNTKEAEEKKNKPTAAAATDTSALADTEKTTPAAKPKSTPEKKDLQAGDPGYKTRDLGATSTNSARSQHKAG